MTAKMTLSLFPSSPLSLLIMEAGRKEGGGPEKPTVAGSAVAFRKPWGFVGEESSGPNYWKLSTSMQGELLFVLCLGPYLSGLKQ